MFLFVTFHEESTFGSGSCAMWQIKAFPKRHAQNHIQTLIEILCDVSVGVNICGAKNPITVGFRESRHLNEKFGLGILHTRSVYVREYVTKVTVRVCKVHQGGQFP